jgi:hypothetical protein
MLSLKDNVIIAFMNELANQFEQYLAGITQERLDASPLPERKRLPHFLQQLYSLYRLRIGPRTYLGILLRDQKQFKPSSFVKHLRQLPLDEIEGYCLIARALPVYVRKKLIENGIPFVVPGSQLFWPALGVVIQQRGSWRQPLAKTAQLSPATQVVILHALTGHIDEVVTPKTLAERLGYTAMTMTRALDEIEANGLGRVTKEGRERRLFFSGGRKTLWEQARPFLRNPIRDAVRLMEPDVPVEFRLLAGESALAARTILGYPPTPAYAVGREAWKVIRENGVEVVPVEEPGTCTLQIWRYNPALFAADGSVDIFSLYLSLQNERDERVESSLDEMMERFSW